MNPIKNYLVLCISIFFSIIFAVACTNNDKKNNTDLKITPTPSPKIALQKALKDCQKVEYVLYNEGLTFETQGKGDIFRFNSFLEEEPNTNPQCPANNFDGGVVYKDGKGDIILSMDFNYLNGCMRAVFTLDGIKYNQKLSPQATAFFNQVSNQTPGSN